LFVIARLDRAIQYDANGRAPSRPFSFSSMRAKRSNPEAGASLTPPAFFVFGLRAQVAGHEFAGGEESAMLRR
jgi:hypothetical protein